MAGIAHDPAAIGIIFSGIIDLTVLTHGSVIWTVDTGRAGLALKSIFETSSSTVGPGRTGLRFTTIGLDITLGAPVAQRTLIVDQVWNMVSANRAVGSFGAYFVVDHCLFACRVQVAIVASETVLAL